MTHAGHGAGYGLKAEPSPLLTALGIDGTAIEYIGDWHALVTDPDQYGALGTAHIRAEVDIDVHLAQDELVASGVLNLEMRDRYDFNWSAKKRGKLELRDMPSIMLGALADFNPLTLEELDALERYGRATNFDVRSRSTRTISGRRIFTELPRSILGMGSAVVRERLAGRRRDLRLHLDPEEAFEWSP